MIDTRGLSCPIPVVMVQKEIKANSPAEITVLADAEVAVENIGRLASSCGYAMKREEKDDEFVLTLTKEA